MPRHEAHFLHYVIIYSPLLFSAHYSSQQAGPCGGYVGLKVNALTEQQGVTVPIDQAQSLGNIVVHEGNTALTMLLCGLSPHDCGDRRMLCHEMPVRQRYTLFLLLVGDIRWGLSRGSNGGSGSTSPLPCDGMFVPYTHASEHPAVAFTSRQLCIP